MVIVWDYKKREIKGSYEIHKVSVQDLCFTSNSVFLISIGGEDDGNVIVWDVQNNSPICGISRIALNIFLFFLGDIKIYIKITEFIFGIT